MTAIALLTVTLAPVAFAESPSNPQAPRLVNIYCFCRQNDFRLDRSEQVLFQATLEQVRLLKPENLPATFALQYGALTDTRHQKLFKE